MTYFGISSAGWIAWTAIGTLALASATVTAIVVASIQTRNDRRRADAERLAEIKRDNDMRAEDRERDDRLRREAVEDIEQRQASERRSTEDYEARQVVVIVKEQSTTSGTQLAANHNRWVTVSAPYSYPIKQVDGTWVRGAYTSLSTVGYGFEADKTVVDQDRTQYVFRARISAADSEVKPIVRFVDWHGNLYFQYEHYTERFPQNTEFHEAAQQIDHWIRTGAKPD